MADDTKKEDDAQRRGDDRRKQADPGFKGPDRRKGERRKPDA